ncbi:MAG TPA: ABC transporter ATP-binding protein [Pirellulales bacterium]|jgi:ABC-type multidrug transport system ATPase subunit|nr:ABC transporter ATP-binding protein [Pirellulales bacterium]
MKLAIQHLSKRYPNGVQALDDVSLSIPTGMFGLLGPNGAGKSTLMRTIATLQEADSGSILLEGIGPDQDTGGRLDVLKDKAEVRKILGYLPQDFGVYPKVTAEDLLDHLATLKGIVPARDRRAVVASLLRKTNLYDVRRQRLGSFSGGMKQRFGIAQALLGNPSIIIVDEPTAGLDPEERVRFHNLLSEIGQQVIVILSTHIVDDVTDLCQQMAIIHRGRVVASGEPSRLAADLEGRIWQKTITKDELAQLESEVMVLSTRLRAGRLVVHVCCESAPDASFVPIEPELADVYFRAIKDRADLVGAVDQVAS